VSSPLLVHYVHLGAASYEYRAVEVTPDGTELFTDTEFDLAYRMRPVRSVACLQIRGPYDCYPEQAIADNGNVTVNTTRYERLPRKEFVWLDERPYRRVTHQRDGATQVSLEPVGAATVLAEASIDVEQARQPERRAIRQGSARSHVATEQARFVETTQGYYWVSSQRTGGAAENRWHLAALAVVAGLLCLRRGDRLWR
jgi:hypothetical protein